MSKPFRVFFSHGAMPTALKSRVFSTESLESGMNHLHAVKSEGQERFSIMEELKEPPINQNLNSALLRNHSVYERISFPAIALTCRNYKQNNLDVQKKLKTRRRAQSWLMVVGPTRFFDWSQYIKCKAYISWVAGCKSCEDSSGAGWSAWPWHKGGRDFNPTYYNINCWLQLHCHFSWQTNQHSYFARTCMMSKSSWRRSTCNEKVFCKGCGPSSLVSLKTHRQGLLHQVLRLEEFQDRPCRPGQGHLLPVLLLPLLMTTLVLMIRILYVCVFLQIIDYQSTLPITLVIWCVRMWRNRRSPETSMAVSSLMVKCSQTLRLNNAFAGLSPPKSPVVSPWELRPRRCSTIWTSARTLSRCSRTPISIRLGLSRSWDSHD